MLGKSIDSTVAALNKFAAEYTLVKEFHFGILRKSKRCWCLTHLLKF
jgi:hypothetical protein